MVNQENNAHIAQGGWAERTVEQFAREVLIEKRRARRWRIFFRIVILLMIIWVLLMLTFSGKSAQTSTGPHTALIKLEGAIYPGDETSAEYILEAIENAYKDSNTKGIILKINSPGGTVVQSALMADGIRRLRAQYPNVPFYVVVDEVCASGGYFVASAAEKIFVNDGSIVGSIGVIYNGFGFTKTMEKLGIERRLVTAGDEKAGMDPFSPESEKSKAHLQAMMNDIHQQFIDAVKLGRGDRLKLDTPDLFSGMVWTGRQSIAFGLVDEVGDVMTVSKEIIKAETIVDFTIQDSFANRLAKQFGATSQLLSKIASETPTGMMMLYVQ